jgi:hypothetical protein
VVRDHDRRASPVQAASQRKHPPGRSILPCRNLAGRDLCKSSHRRWPQGHTEGRGQKHGHATRRMETTRSGWVDQAMQRRQKHGHATRRMETLLRSTQVRPLKSETRSRHKAYGNAARTLQPPGRCSSEKRSRHKAYGNGTAATGRTAPGGTGGQKHGHATRRMETLNLGRFDPPGACKSETRSRHKAYGNMMPSCSVESW